MLINFGDMLFEKLTDMIGSLGGLAWTGEAWQAMKDASGSVQDSVKQVAEEFWHTGEMINYYALERTNQEKTQAAQSLATLIASIVGVVLGALFFAGSAIIDALAAGVAALTRVFSVVNTAVSALRTMATSVGEFVGSAVNSVANTLPSWAVTMAGVTGNVARFGIEGFGLNAASVAAGNAAAGLPTTAKELVPVPTSLEQLPEFIANTLLLGAVGGVVGSAAKGLANAAKTKLDGIRVDVNVNTANVRTATGESATGTGTGTGLKLPSQTTSVSATIADSSKGLSKSDLTLSSKAQVNSADITTAATGGASRVTATAPRTTEVVEPATAATGGVPKVTASAPRTTTDAEPATAPAGGGDAGSQVAAASNKVTPVDAGASPGGSSAVKTTTDGTQPVQPAPKSDAVGGSSNVTASGAGDHSTGSSGSTVLKDVGSGLGDVVKTAQAAQKSANGSTVAHQAGASGAESVGASGADRGVRTNLEPQPTTAAPHETVPQTPTQTSGTGGHTTHDAGASTSEAAKAIDTGVKQAQNALRTADDGSRPTTPSTLDSASAGSAVDGSRPTTPDSVSRASVDSSRPTTPDSVSRASVDSSRPTTPDSVSRASVDSSRPTTPDPASRASAEETGPRVQSVPGAKQPQIVQQASVKEHSAEIVGSGPGTHETTGSASAKSAEGTGMQANLADTAVRSGTDQRQGTAGAVDGQVPNAGRAPLTSEAGLGGRQLQPARSAAPSPVRVSQAGEKPLTSRPDTESVPGTVGGRTAADGPTTGKTSPVESAGVTPSSGGVSHGVSAKSASEAHASEPTVKGESGGTTSAGRGAAEAQSSARRGDIGSERVPGAESAARDTLSSAQAAEARPSMTDTGERTSRVEATAGEAQRVADALRSDADAARTRSDQLKSGLEHQVEAARQRLEADTAVVEAVKIRESATQDAGQKALSKLNSAKAESARVAKAKRGGSATRAEIKAARDGLTKAQEDHAEAHAEFKAARADRLKAEQRKTASAADLNALRSALPEAELAVLSANRKAGEAELTAARADLDRALRQQPDDAAAREVALDRVDKAEDALREARAQEQAQAQRVADALRSEVDAARTRLDQLKAELKSPVEAAQRRLDADTAAVEAAKVRESEAEKAGREAGSKVESAKAESARVAAAQRDGTATPAEIKAADDRLAETQKAHQKANRQLYRARADREAAQGRQTASAADLTALRGAVADAIWAHHTAEVKAEAAKARAAEPEAAMRAAEQEHEGAGKSAAEQRGAVADSSAATAAPRADAVSGSPDVAKSGAGDHATGGTVLKDDGSDLNGTGRTAQSARKSADTAVPAGADRNPGAEDAAHAGTAAKDADRHTDSADTAVRSGTDRRAGRTNLAEADRRQDAVRKETAARIAEAERAERAAKGQGAAVGKAAEAPGGPSEAARKVVGARAARYEAERQELHAQGAARVVAIRAEAARDRADRALGEQPEQTADATAGRPWKSVLGKSTDRGLQEGVLTPEQLSYYTASHAARKLPQSDAARWGEADEWGEWAAQEYRDHGSAGVQRVMDALQGRLAALRSDADAAQARLNQRKSELEPQLEATQQRHAADTAAVNAAQVRESKAKTAANKKQYEVEVAKNEAKESQEAQKNGSGTPEQTKAAHDRLAVAQNAQARAEARWRKANKDLEGATQRRKASAADLSAVHRAIRDARNGDTTRGKATGAEPQAERVTGGQTEPERAQIQADAEAARARVSEAEAVTQAAERDLEQTRADLGAARESDGADRADVGTVPERAGADAADGGARAEEVAARVRMAEAERGVSEAEAVTQAAERDLEQTRTNLGAARESDGAGRADVGTVPERAGADAADGGARAEEVAARVRMAEAERDVAEARADEAAARAHLAASDLAVARADLDTVLRQQRDDADAREAALDRVHKAEDALFDAQVHAGLMQSRSDRAATAVEKAASAPRTARQDAAEAPSGRQTAHPDEGLDPAARERAISGRLADEQAALREAEQRYQDAAAELKETREREAARVAAELKETREREAARVAAEQDHEAAAKSAAQQRGEVADSPAVKAAQASAAEAARTVAVTRATVKAAEEALQHRQTDKAELTSAQKHVAEAEDALQRAREELASARADLDAVLAQRRDDADAREAALDRVHKAEDAVRAAEPNLRKAQSETAPQERDTPAAHELVMERLLADSARARAGRNEAERTQDATGERRETAKAEAAYWSKQAELARSDAWDARQQAAEAAVREVQVKAELGPKVEALEQRAAEAARARLDAAEGSRSEAPSKSAAAKSDTQAAAEAEKPGKADAQTVSDLRSRLAEAEQTAHDTAAKAEVEQIWADHLAERADVAAARQTEPDAEVPGARKAGWHALVTGREHDPRRDTLTEERVAYLVEHYALKEREATESLSNLKAEAEQAKVWGALAAKEFERGGAAAVQTVMDALTSHLAELRQARQGDRSKHAAQRQEDPVLAQARRSGMSWEAAHDWADHVRQAWQSRDAAAMRDAWADFQRASDGVTGWTGRPATGRSAHGTKDPSAAGEGTSGRGRGDDTWSEPDADTESVYSDRSDAGADATERPESEPEPKFQLQKSEDSGADFAREARPQVAVMERAESHSPLSATMADLLKGIHEPDEEPHLPAGEAEKASGAESARGDAADGRESTDDSGRPQADADTARAGESADRGTGDAAAADRPAAAESVGTPAARRTGADTARASATVDHHTTTGAVGTPAGERTVQPGRRATPEDVARYKAEMQEWDRKAQELVLPRRQAAADATLRHQPASAAADHHATAEAAGTPAGERTVQPERRATPEDVARYKAELQRAARAAQEDVSAARQAVADATVRRQAAEAELASARWQLETEVEANLAADAVNEDAQSTDSRSAIAATTESEAPTDEPSTDRTPSETVGDEPSPGSAEPSEPARQTVREDPIAEARQAQDEPVRMVADWHEQRVQETTEAAHASAETVRQAQAQAGDGTTLETAVRQAAADESAAQAARAEADRWNEQRQAATQVQAAETRPTAPDTSPDIGFTGARFAGRQDLSTPNHVSPLLPTSDQAIILDGPYNLADNRMYVDGVWRTAAQVAQYIRQLTSWDPETPRPVVLMAGQAGRENVPAGLPSFGGQVAEALNTLVVAPVGQPVQLGPTEIVAGTPVPDQAGGVNLRVDNGEGFALNVPGQRRGVQLTQDVNTALSFLGATLEPGSAPPTEPVIWSFGPQAPPGIARYTAPRTPMDLAPDAGSGVGHEASAGTDAGPAAEDSVGDPLVHRVPGTGTWIRTSFPETEWAVKGGAYPYLGELTEFTQHRVDPVTGERQSRKRPLPWLPRPGSTVGAEAPRAHFWGSHANAKGFGIAQQDGTSRLADGTATGRMLKRRNSFAALPETDILVLLTCKPGEAQKVADETGMRVFAPRGGRVEVRPPTDGREAELWLLEDDQGQPTDWDEFHPHRPSVPTSEPADGAPALSADAWAPATVVPGPEYQNAIGLEVEDAHILQPKSGVRNLPEIGEVLARGPGITVVAEKMTFHKRPDGRWYRGSGPRVNGRPRYETEKKFIAEFVLDPMALHPGEERHRQSVRAGLATLKAGRRALRVTDRRGEARSLRRLLGGLPEWTVTEEGRKFDVLPTADDSYRWSYVQPSLGGTADSLRVYQDEALRRLTFPSLHKYVTAGRDFGQEVAAQFVRRETGEMDVTRDQIPFLSMIPDIDEAWGYGWHTFTHVGARQLSGTLNPAILTKNALMTASRTYFAGTPRRPGIREALRPATLAFLNDEREDIREVFNTFLEGVLEEYEQESGKDSGSPDDFHLAVLLGGLPPADHPAYDRFRKALRRLPETDPRRMPVEEVLAEDLHERTVDMSDFPVLDNGGGLLERALVVLEFRHFGLSGQLMSDEEIAQAVEELSALARASYDRSLKFSRPLSGAQLRDLVQRVTEHPVVRAFAPFLEVASRYDMPMSEGDTRTPLTTFKALSIAQMLGRFALGKPVTADSYRELRELVQDVKGAAQVAPPHPDALGDTVRTRVLGIVREAERVLPLLDPTRPAAATPDASTLSPDGWVPAGEDHGAEYQNAMTEEPAAPALRPTHPTRRAPDAQPVSAEVSEPAVSSGRELVRSLSTLEEEKENEDAAASDGGASLTQRAAVPVPKIVVTAPDEPGDRTPWYMGYDAMGQAVVPDSVEQIEFTQQQAKTWAERVSEQLELPESATDPKGALRAGIRDAVEELLLATETKHWDDILAAGRTLVVDGRLVWLRPVPRELTFLPPGNKTMNEHPIWYGSTKGGESSNETTLGADAVLSTTLNLGSAAAASAIGIVSPQMLVGSSKSKQQGWSRTVLSSRKLNSNEFNRFSSGLEVRVFVGGEEATPQGRRVTVPDRILVDLPAPYSGEEGHKPDPLAPEQPRPKQPRKGGPSQAREMLNAVDMTPLIAGLHRNLLEAGLPASAVKKFLHRLEMDTAKGFLTEPTAQNRYLFWSGGDVSNSVEVNGSLLGKKFKGHVRLHASVDGLQYVGDTKVESRDDIGAGTNRAASSKGASVGGLGGGYGTVGLSGGTDPSTAGGILDSAPETDQGASPAASKVEVKGVAPVIGGSVTSKRGTGYGLKAGQLSQTILTTSGDQSRYRVALRLAATVESSTHNVKPVQITTESELSVPKREAAEFVNRVAGPGWTPDLRRVEDGPDAPRHQVLTSPAPRTVRRLPTARSPFRFGLSGSQDGLRRNPHAREPLALASRRGFGFSVPIALPGTQALQGDIREAIAQHHEKAVGSRKAEKSDWAAADRDLALFYSRSALEGDPHQALLGIHRTIEVAGRRYKVSAKMRWGDRINDPNSLVGSADPAKDPAEQTYTMKVNARNIGNASVQGERSRGTTGSFAFGGGARVAIPEHEYHIGGSHFTTPAVRLDLGAFRGLISPSWKKAQKFSGLTKPYRRTGTAGEVQEHRYWTTIEWTVTPESDKPSYLSGQVPAVARVVTALEHAPEQPVTPKQARTAGKVSISKNRPRADRPLDFGTGTQGIYPAFHMMPELAQLAAGMYAEQHKLPDSWLRDPSQWPEEILDLAHPVILGSGFDSMTGAQGYESELPQTGKYKEAFRVKLRTDAPEDLGPSSEVEVQHQLQGAAAYEEEKSSELELGLRGSAGPLFRFGSDSQGGSRSGPGGRVAVVGLGGAAAKWGSGKAAKAGRADVTRALYGGEVHTLRTKPVFELTYVRWRGKELTETTRYLSAKQALDLLVPKRRLDDVMPPTPESESKPEAQPKPESQAQPEQADTAAEDLTATANRDQIPTIVVTPPDEERKLTRTYMSPDLIAGVGHPEVLRAEGVLDEILRRLRDRGVVTTETAPGVAPRPNLLTRSLTASFSSDALATEMHSMTTDQGFSRWLPIPGPLGSTRYLWVKVTATRLGPATGQQPRDDVKLLLRGDSEHEAGESESSGVSYGGGLYARARGGAGGVYGGAEGGVGYTSSRGSKVESADKAVKTSRTNPGDVSEEFNHVPVFQVETGITTELPEFLSTPARAIGGIARLYSGAPSRDKGVFQWYDAGDGTEGNSPLVEGKAVRLLVPRHMTVETYEPAQAIDLTRVRETSVTWEPAPPRKPNKVQKRNRAQQASELQQSAAPAPPKLPKALVEGLHPWSVPAAASIKRWAGLTAVRRRTAPQLDRNAPPKIGGLNFTTRAGLRYSHFTSGSMLRAHTEQLLEHTYQVPVGGHQVTVGFELDSAEILGPVEGTPLKQRTFTLRTEEPKSETERESGWDISFGPDAGGSTGGDGIFERLPFTVRNLLKSRNRSAATGDTDERSKESARPYRQYRFGVAAVIKGPHGIVRVKVPGGLYGALPVDAATGKLADNLEAELNGLLAPRQAHLAPPSGPHPASRAAVSTPESPKPAVPAPRTSGGAEPGKQAEQGEPEEQEEPETSQASGASTTLADEPTAASAPVVTEAESSTRPAAGATAEAPAAPANLAAPAASAAPRRTLAPASERLTAYAEALTEEDDETPGSREVMWAKRSPALKTSGAALPERFVEIEDSTVGYTPAEENPEANVPQSGGRFVNLFGRYDDGTTLAVMAENYRAPGEGFTAADAFVHQWSTATSVLVGDKLSAKNLSKKITADLQRPLSAADVPDRLPDRIYRQNISGARAKKVLNEVLGEDMSTIQFALGDAAHEKVLETVNGKSTLNIVRTFNELKGHASDDAHLITGGTLLRDSNGNFQLRFDIARTADVLAARHDDAPAPDAAAPADLVSASAQGRPVKVPATGECLLYSLLASDPHHVRDRLPGLAEKHPTVHAWLGDVEAVRKAVRAAQKAYSENGSLPDGPYRTAVEVMRSFVEHYLDTHNGRLDPQILGHLRQPEGSPHLAALDGLNREELLKRLGHHGVTDRAMSREALEPSHLRTGSLAETALPRLDDLTDDGLRAQFRAVYPYSAAALDEGELILVTDAVVNWEQRWQDPAGEMFLPLLAHAFGVRADVVRPGAKGEPDSYGPADAQHRIEFHYNGDNHYDGSDAIPAGGKPSASWALEASGDSAEPLDGESAVPAPEVVETTGPRHSHAMPPGGPGLSSAVVSGATGRAAADFVTPAATAGTRPWATAWAVFEEGSKDLTPDERGRLTTLAYQLAERGRRDILAGLPFRITVTGYGNGSWMMAGSSDWGAERVGRQRADAVADVLRTELWNALYLIQQNEPPAQRVDSDAFKITTRSGGRNVVADGTSDGGSLRTLRRRATIEIEVSDRSAAFEQLDALRLADPELREGPFDADLIARGILGLDPAEPVTGAHFRELHTVVEEAVAAGRATSLAALAAYHLVRQGALSDATRITAPDGRALGRNWTRRPVTDLVPMSYAVWDAGQLDDLQPALWQRQTPGDHRPYVIVAEGDQDHVVVTLANGSRRRVPVNVFAELLTMDPDLAALDGSLPVVLAVSEAGAGGLRLPRTAAARTGRTVWSHSGNVTLDQDTVVKRTRIAVNRRAHLGQHLGSWFASGPDDLRAGDPTAEAEKRVVQTVDGTLIPDDEILSETMAADGIPHGRAVFTKADMLRREVIARAAPELMRSAHIDPVTGEQYGEPDDVPWAGRKAYYFFLHGRPGGFALVSRDGTVKWTLGDPVGEFLQRRPSVRGLAPDGVIVLMSCWVGAPSEEPVSPGDVAGRAPFVPDPLELISAAQRVANKTGRTVFAVDRTLYADPSGVWHWIAMTADGKRSRWAELRPEPTRTGLDTLARTAGLHTGEGPASAEDRVTTLRLVRALRLTFGVAVEDDKDDAAGRYQRLLRGIGALETMRRNDELLRDSGPFTLDLLDRAARSRLGRSPDESTALTPDDVEALLEAASTQRPGVALRDFVPLPSVERVLTTPPDGDPDQRVREVLRLGSNPVTAVHRQRALWAMVKAVEVLEAAPDLPALAAKVLHLDAGAGPVDDARIPELFSMLAQAAAAGRDPHNPAAVAAFHLQINGALSDGTLLHSRSGRVIGRNWTGRPLTDPIVRDTYRSVAAGADPAQAPARQVPWHDPAAVANKTSSAYFLVADGGPGHIEMPWPDGSRRPVPADEIAELLTQDPHLSRYASTTPLVPVVRHSGSGRALAKALSDRAATSRNVVSPAVAIDLFHDTTAGEYVLVVTSPPAGARPSDWIYDLPAKLAAPTPATSVAPAPPVTTVASHVTTGTSASAASSETGDPALTAARTAFQEGDRRPDVAEPALEPAALMPADEYRVGVDEDDAEATAPQASAVGQPAAEGAGSSAMRLAETGEGPMPNGVVDTFITDIFPQFLTWSEEHRFFVADGGSPSEVLTEGLKPGGQDLDIHAYAMAGQAARADYGFVGAVGSIEAAARRLSSGYVWEIDAPGGIDVKATLERWGQAYEDTGEGEVLFAGGVKSLFIKRGWKIVAEGEVESLEIRNPHHAAGPSRQQPVEPVGRETHVFRMQDVVSADELQELAAAFLRNKEEAERYADELGMRLENHINNTLSEQGKSADDGIDLHLILDSQDLGAPGMVLAAVVADSFGQVEFRIADMPVSYICPRT
ncbi:MAG: lonely Cys domain-containing protein [Streptomyces sp.]|nr:lonely Cys domain-containing protein [Streptomyces sp.]